MATKADQVIPLTTIGTPETLVYFPKDLFNGDKTHARKAAEYLSKNMPNKRAVVTGAFYEAFENRNENVMNLLLEFQLVESNTFDYDGGYDAQRFDRCWIVKWYATSLHDALIKQDKKTVDFLLRANNCFAQSCELHSELFCDYDSIRELEKRKCLNLAQRSMILKNVYITHLKTITQPATNQRDCFYPLFIEAANVCIILLQKRPFEKFSSYACEDRSEFHRMRCYTDETCRLMIPDKVTDDSSLNAVGILMTASSDPDTVHFDSTIFWVNKAKYISDKLAIQVLQNSFVPSPELQSGFDYKHEAIVVRGHGKHLSGEASALAELRGELEDLLEEVSSTLAPKSINADTKKKVTQAHQTLCEIKSILEKNQFNPKKLKDDVDSKLDNLFKVTQDITYLRLYETNSQIENQIKDKKTLVETLVKDLGQLVTEGYFSEGVSQKDLQGLIQGLSDVLNEISLEVDQTARRAELQKFWNGRAEELKNVIIKDAVTTAHGPIIRVYQEVKLDTSEKLLEASTHLSSSIIDIPSYVDPSLYLKSSNYRRDLILFLNELCIFYQGLGVLLPNNMNLEQLKQDIKDLEGIDTYWNQFSSIDHDQLNLSSVQLVDKELATKFEKRLKKNLGVLSSMLVSQGPPRFRRVLKEKGGEVLKFIFKKMDLIDSELKLGGQITQEANGSIRYMDLYYSLQRMKLDAQLFLIMMGYIQSEYIPMNPFTDLMKFMFGRLSSLKKTERTYGPFKKKMSISHPLNDLGQLLDNSIETLDHIIKAFSLFDQNNDASTKLSELKDKLKKLGEKSKELGDKIVAIFDADDFSEDLRKQFNQHIADQNNCLSEIQTSLNDIQKIFTSHMTIDRYRTVEKNYQQNKTILTQALKRIRNLSTDKFPLYKDINALIQIAEKGEASGGVNKGIKNAKESVSVIKSKLQRLKKGTTPYDLLLRNDAIEKLTHVEVALTSDPKREFYVRIKELRQGIEKMCKNALDIADFQQKINQLPGLNSLNLDQNNLEEGLKTIQENLIINGLQSDIKNDWLQLELNLANKLMKEIESEMSYYYCKQWSDDFMSRVNGVDLSLIRREWAADSRQKIVSTYSWSKSPMNSDPYFPANETHIRI